VGIKWAEMECGHADSRVIVVIAVTAALKQRRAE